MRPLSSDGDTHVDEMPICTDIHVPADQIVDTVSLYHIPSRQRKLSLRLLSFVVLHHDIQNAGTHDSIEDARTALQLYEVYAKLVNEGRWEDELEELYHKGRDLVRLSCCNLGCRAHDRVFQGWKVPVLEATPEEPPSASLRPPPSASSPAVFAGPHSGSSTPVSALYPGVPFVPRAGAPAFQPFLGR